MTFTDEITIQAPREKVVELFDNPENMKKWMDGLQSFEHISGTPGQPGAKSRLKFKTGKREVEMIETVTVRNLPDEFTGTYEADDVWSQTKNFFRDNGDGTTTMIAENEFRLTGFMKFLGMVMPGVFKKQSRLFLKSFKSFVEAQS